MRFYLMRLLVLLFVCIKLYRHYIMSICALVDKCNNNIIYYIRSINYYTSMVGQFHHLSLKKLEVHNNIHICNNIFYSPSITRRVRNVPTQLFDYNIL